MSPTEAQNAIKETTAAETVGAMSELPKGWRQVKLGELAEYLNGAAFKPDDWGDKGMPIIRIQNLNDPSRPMNRTTKPVNERLRVQNGDILVSWSATLDAFIWDRGEAWLNQHIFRVLPRERLVDKRFLFFLLKKEIAALIETEHLHGSTMRHINRGPFLSHQVPLPPLDEQRRIVARLDTLLARSKRARAELARVPGLVERQRQAVLEAAFSGELTREWRLRNRKTLLWESRLIGQILSAVVAGKNLRCEERPPNEHENGVLKISAVTWGRFDPLAAKTLPLDFQPPENTRVKEGDFLISRANTIDLVGTVVIVDKTPANLFLSDKVLRLDMLDEYKPWVLWFLRSARGRSTIEQRATGNQLSMRNLSQESLSKIEIPWPSGAEQAEIVRRIESAFARIDRAAAEAERAAALLDRLDQTTLARAFQGKL